MEGGLRWERSGENLALGSPGRWLRVPVSLQDRADEFGDPVIITPPPPPPGTALLPPGATAPLVHRPAAPFALALLGGVTILLAGLVQLTILNPLGSPPFFGLALWVSGPLGVGLGSAVIFFGAMMYQHPDRVVLFGSLVTAFSAASYLSFLGGFLIGLILGVVGGILGIVWKPGPTAPFYYPMMPTFPTYRTCLKCGRSAAWDARYCAYCGNVFG